MLDMTSVVEAWDWHVAGQGIRVFRPGWREFDEKDRLRWMAEPWGHPGLVGVVTTPTGLLFMDARGSLADSVSGRLALAAAQRWERGENGEAQAPVAVAVAQARVVDASGAGQFPGMLVTVAGASFRVLDALTAGVALTWADVDALGALAARVWAHTADDNSTVVVVDLPARRVAGVRPGGQFWRGPADVLGPAVAYAAEKVPPATEAMGRWWGLSGLGVTAQHEEARGLVVTAVPYLTGLRRFYRRPDERSPFVIR
jgi:hypothetical protein